MITPELIKPEYERQPEETLKQWEMFIMYRDMGVNRTLKAVAKEIYKGEKFENGYKYITIISCKWKWKERVKAYQVYVENLKKIQLKKDVEEMVSRHSEFAKKAQQVCFIPFNYAITRYNKLQNDINKLMNEFSSLSPEEKIQRIKSLEDNSLQRLPFDDLLKLAKDITYPLTKLAELERTSRGEPIEITKQDITSDGESIAPQINIVVHGSKSKILKDDADEQLNLQS